MGPGSGVNQGPIPGFVAEGGKKTMFAIAMKKRQRAGSQPKALGQGAVSVPERIFDIDKGCSAVERRFAATEKVEIDAIGD
jgi:hypothetical protein